MSSLFDKIATLVNAQVNDLLGKNPRSPLARIKLDAEEARKDPRRSAQTLRQRLEEAIAYEDEIQAKIDRLMQEALELDEEVDSLLQSDDEFTARRLQGQLNMKQQQLTIAEAELRDHRLLTRHLMQELGTLETALASQENRIRRQTDASNKAPRRTSIPIEGSGGGDKTILDSVSDKLNETKESLENLLNNSPVPASSESPPRFAKFEIIDEEPDPRQSRKPEKDTGKMDARLSRLSKPAEDD